MNISVIVPVFNAESYLRTCVDSILSQNDLDNVIELVLIDDGSTDESGRICDEYKGRAIVIHTENSGASKARNLGISCARGDYIAFVDADDWVENGHFSRMASAIRETNADMAISGLKYVEDEESREYYRESTPASEGVYEGRDKLHRILLPLIGGGLDDPLKRAASGSVCFSLYRRELIENIKFPPTRIAEDLIFQLYAVNTAGKIVVTNDYLYCYRVPFDAESRSHRFFPDLWENQKELLSYMHEFAENSGHNDSIEERVLARTVRESLKAAGNECEPENKSSPLTKITKIKSIFSERDVYSAIAYTEGREYNKRTGQILKLMKNNRALIMFLYFSYRKKRAAGGNTID